MSDVFGLKVNAFYETPTPISYELDGQTYKTDVRFYEVPELSTATTLAHFQGLPTAVPAITTNHFGKGQALYIAMPSSDKVMQPVLLHLIAQLGIHWGPETPDGVYARTVQGRTLYVNSTTLPQSISLPGLSHLTLSGIEVRNTLQLQPFEVELVESEK